MNLLFGFEGRIGRLQWWLAQIVGMTLFGAGIFLLDAMLPPGQLAAAALALFYFAIAPIEALKALVAALSGTGFVALLCLLTLTIWINVASSAKRYHDRGRSGWWFLLNFIPYIGSLIVFIELGFFAAKDIDNPYGSRGSDGGYTQPSWDSAYDDFAEPAPRMQNAASAKIAVPTTPSLPSTNAQRPSFGQRS